MRFYTLWKGKEDGSGDATLLDNEKLFKMRRKAFKRAEKLAARLKENSGDAILVRHVTLGNDICDEYVFAAPKAPAEA